MYLEAEKLGDYVSETVMQSNAAQQLLTPGRVVVVKSQSVSVSLLFSLDIVFPFPIVVCGRQILCFAHMIFLISRFLDLCIFYMLGLEVDSLCHLNFC